MKLSDDKYKLPEVTATSCRKLAEICNVSPKTIKNSYYGYKAGRLKTERFTMVYIPDEEVS